MKKLCLCLERDPPLMGEMIGPSYTYHYIVDFKKFKILQNLKNISKNTYQTVYLNTHITISNLIKTKRARFKRFDIQENHGLFN